MWDLRACTVCFSTEVKLFNMDSCRLRHEYNFVSGLKTQKGDGMPDYLCMECSAYVRRFKKFRDKCHRAHYALQEILHRNNEIKKANIEAFDRESIDILPTLSYLDVDKSHYQEMKFKWVKYNRLSIVKGDIPIVHCSTLTNENIFEVPQKKTRLQTNLSKSQSDEKDVKLETDNNVICKSDVPVDELNYDGKEESCFQQVTNNVNDSEATIIDNYFDNDDNFDSDNCQEYDSYGNIPSKVEEKMEDQAVDGSNLDEEYASMIPISVKEARAAVEVYKMFSHGKFRCQICNKGYYTENRLKVHLRMHDKHVSGTFFCDLCNYYYKTDFLLKTHMTEKHMYKYVCRKCPEVSFDRISAKQHYIWTHLQKGNKKNANWYDSRPSWLSAKGGKRVKGVVSLRPVRKIKKLPEDFPIYSTIGQKEQYELVAKRRETRNYTDAEHKCNLCFRGFREAITYSKHMRKHDPAFAGPYQCDMCKLHFRDTRKVYKHMNITHLFKYSCQMCTYVCYNRGQAQMHYRWHKNVTYQCPHCKKEFKKASTRLTHIRIKHPSTNICNMCGHSFVSETGLYCHKKLAHSKEEIESSESTPVNTEDRLYCSDCNIQFLTQAAFSTHLGSSNKHASTNLSITKLSKTGERRKRGRPRRGMSEVLNNGVATSTACEVCGEHLSNDVQARKHYQTEHPGAEFLKRYMCDVCGHTTKQYANLMVHMRTHTNEKPYGCPHCERRFSMPSNRDRHLVVHTGEKRYQCQYCNRRFTQSSAVKLHIQTVHLKIPYAPWDKKNRKRRKELESTSAPMTAADVAAAAACLQQQSKILTLETQGDYLNAYITYNDE